MITVLCPSRGRPDLLAESLRSLQTNAAQPFEILVGADCDDPDTRTVADAAGAETVVFWDRHGYRGLHHYYNTLAGLAQGDWLLLWNDDARMGSVGWDTYIESHDEMVVETIKGICFPAVPKRWVDHLGHFSGEWHCDAWWEQIGTMLGRRVRAALDGSHDNPDDQTSDEARGQKRNPGFYGAANMALIRADADRIRELL